MLEISESILSKLSVHFVGNKSKEEGYTASETAFEMDDYLNEVMLRYFLKPFKTGTDLFKFKHESELGLNELYTYCKTIFESPDKFHLYSINMLKHLYEQSEHPHIKRGEFYVAYITDLILEGEMVNAIGIFKSEQKETFLKTKDRTTRVEIDVQEGIDIKKLDKGCLVFNTEMESGYRIMMVDQNNYDTHYWTNDFLNVEADKNEVFLTKHVINMCKDFGKEVVSREESAQDKALFVAKSLKYMQENEQFSMDEFQQEVFADKTPEMAERFVDYKNVYQQEKEIPNIETFDLSKNTLKQEKRKIRNTIELDTNIQIKLNFNDLQSGSKFLERGYDPEKDMYYYKVFFKHEKR